MPYLPTIKSTVNTTLLIGLAVAAFLLILFLCTVCYCICQRCRRGKNKNSASSKASEKQALFNRSDSKGRKKVIPESYDVVTSWKVHTVTEYTYAELQAATNNFGPDNEANQGPSGTVFWGTLPTGPAVAVKRVPTGNSKAAKAAFKKQRSQLGELVHPNLASLMGYCPQQREHIMVFERPSNGTLRGHLYGPLARKDPLDWTHRLETAVGIAGALSYLHNEASYEPIVYGDVASSNILLDKNLHAKLSGLALCKSAVDELEYHRDLEEGRKSPDHLSAPASDVFSFGLVLLEIFTGNNRSENEHLICEWARPQLDLDRVSTEMDRRIPSDTSLEALQKLAHAALRCLAPSQKVRPSIEEVLQELKVALALHHSATGHLPPKPVIVNEASRTIKLEAVPARTATAVSPPRDALLGIQVVPRAEQPKVARSADVPTTESLRKVAEKLRETEEKEMPSLGVEGAPGLRASPSAGRRSPDYARPFGESWTQLNLGLIEQQPPVNRAKPAWMLD